MTFVICGCEFGLKGHRAIQTKPGVYICPLTERRVLPKPKQRKR